MLYPDWQGRGIGRLLMDEGRKSLARARVTTGYSAVGGINPNVSHPSPCGASHWYSQVKQSLST